MTKKIKISKPQRKKNNKLNQLTSQNKLNSSELLADDPHIIKTPLLHLDSNDNDTKQDTLENNKHSSHYLNLMNRIDYKKLIYGVVFASSLPLFSAITAFSTAPETITNPQIVRLVLPVAIDKVELNPAIHRQHYVLEESIFSDDTLDKILKRSGVKFSSTLIELTKTNHLLKQFKPYGEQPTIHFELNSNYELISMRYRSALDKEILVSNKNNSNRNFAVIEKNIVLIKKLADQSFEIQNNLTPANLKNNTTGIPSELAEKLFDVLYSQFDLYKTLKKGDKIRVLSDAFYYQDEFIQRDQIKAIEINFANLPNRPKREKLTYYFYKNQYYSDKGQQLKSAFLETPVEFANITSGYDLHRVHPILGYSRHHLGVDFAAPEGYRVKATAQGIVKFIGQQNGYGNVVMIEHPNGYETLYAHLKEFSPVLTVGDKIGQGEIIGYVGTTGMSTGPHVHYEIRHKGQHIDPFGPEAPKKLTLDHKFYDAFRKDIQVYAERLKNESQDITL